MMKTKQGAYYSGSKTSFTVWAPFREKIELIFKEKEQRTALQKDDKGYWRAEVPAIRPGHLYKYVLDNKKELPDPASFSQPEGVHSWSAIVDHGAFEWSDSDWKSIPMKEMVLYELHVGTFTEEGTFEAVIKKLDHLLELGVNTIELMPVASFPGKRNWGYDGTYPFAVQESYGGISGLKKLVDGCHNKGIAVVLDVVYNHLGPEGNYLAQYGPYFTDKYTTPWGSAINFDDAYADEVRNFFIQNALMWLDEFHIDGLRLDAVHEIIDMGATHFLKELHLEADNLRKRIKRNPVLIAESDLNDSRIVDDYERGGYGLEGQWVDDFHHSVHTLLTGEKEGYYADYGTMEYLAKTFRQGFVYDGIYSGFRKKSVGNSPAGLSVSSFLVCIQNHDQIGNRMLGERLTALVSFEQLKLAAGILLISPYVPLLFMGEEFAENNPFLYFISHGEPELIKAVREGRKREFQYFFEEDGDFPDPQSEETFQRSKLQWDFKKDKMKNTMFNYYSHLIKLRKEGAFKSFRDDEPRTKYDEEECFLKVWSGDGNLIALINCSDSAKSEHLLTLSGKWQLLFASADKVWEGPERFPEVVNEGEGITIPPNSLLVIKNNKNKS